MEFLVVDRQLTPLVEAKAAQQMAQITINTQNFKITEPPEPHDIVASYQEVF